MNMSLAQYIKRRNGIPFGSSGSLKNNLYRSFGAKNFSSFWNYWNPIFGYYLGTKVFKPLRKYFSSSAALIITFVFCGMFHDTVTSIFRWKISLFFTIWFLFMGTGVLISRYLKHNFSEKIWILRALFNLLIIGICLVLAIYFNNFLNKI
jgi:hypothetical protein